MLNLINPIKITVLVTFLIALTNLRFKNLNHLYLIFVLLTCFLIEYVSVFLKYFNIPNHNLATFGVIIHHSLWLLIIMENVAKSNKTAVCIGFVLFSLINYFFIEGNQNFDIMTFILGAFGYIFLFLFYCFKHLKNENLTFFTSNTFILLSSPVIFFLGMSFLFGFKNSSLDSTIVFGKITLYQFINSVVNVFYYLLINVYIYKEKRNNE